MKLTQKQINSIARKLATEDKLIPAEDKLIPACGYCRFSSDNQKEESIEAQQRLIKDFASRNGYHIKKWYIDRAISGKTVKRPDFQRLLKDIDSPGCEYKAVIVHKIDRFSRSAVDSINYKDILSDYGIDLVSTVEHIENNPNGNLLYGIMSLVNQYYVENLANEVLKGMTENALNNKWNGGTPPLGYDVVNKELVINEREATIVRLIFQMSAEGQGYNKIIKKLNELGYKTKSGNTFGKNSLYDLLQNERYKGVYTFNKRAKRTSDNKRNNRKYKDESEIVRCEGGCPAIVSPELWERANTSRKIMGRTSTGAKTKYLLSGLIYCGECGSKFHGNHRKDGLNGYNTYKCNKQANKLDCFCKEIRADYLEELVIDSLSEFFYHPEIIDIITEEVNRHLKEELMADKEDIRIAKNSINGLKIARNNLVEALAKTGYNETISSKLNSIEKQISDYESLIESDSNEKEALEISRDQVEEKIREIKSILKDPENAELSKVILNSYIEKIVVDNRSVKIMLKMAIPYDYNNTENEVDYKHMFTIQREKIIKERMPVRRRASAGL